MSRPTLLPALLVAAFGAGVTVGRRAPSPAPVPRVFELRTYTAPPDRLPALERRFREHALALFARHGMTNVACWTPADSARVSNTLVYLLAAGPRSS